MARSAWNRKAQASLGSGCRALAFLLLLALYGCGGETALLIVIDGDFQVPSELDALGLHVTIGEAVAFDETFVLSSTDALPQSVELTPGPYSDELLRITIVGLSGGESGDQVALGEATAQFEEGEQRRIDIRLRHYCAESCEGWQICRLGICEDQTCDDADDCDDGLYCNGIEVCDGDRCGPGDAVRCSPDTVDIIFGIQR